MSDLQLVLLLGCISMMGMLAATAGTRFALAKIGHAQDRDKQISIIVALALLTIPPWLFGHLGLASLALFAPSAALLSFASLVRSRATRRRNHQR